MRPIANRRWRGYLGPYTTLETAALEKGGDSHGCCRSRRRNGRCVRAGHGDHELLIGRRPFKPLPLSAANCAHEGTNPTGRRSDYQQDSLVLAQPKVRCHWVGLCKPRRVWVGRSFRAARTCTGDWKLPGQSKIRHDPELFSTFFNRNTLQFRILKATFEVTVSPLNSTSR